MRTRVVGGMGVSGLVAVAGSTQGLPRVRGGYAGRVRGFQRAVLASLLVTQIFLVWLDQGAGVAGLAADLLAPGVVTAELNAMAGEAGD